MKLSSAKAIIVLSIFGTVSFVLTILTSYPDAFSHPHFPTDLKGFFPAKLNSYLIFGVFSIVCLVTSFIMLFRKLPKIDPINEYNNRLLDIEELGNEKTVTKPYPINSIDNNISLGE
jgi:hypothetical protein